jgi:UDP-2,3-diacylglucosamine pyrophosphatase LpxH
MEQPKPVTRLVVISDLHLGGVEPCMMTQPQQLAAFIAGLPQRLAQDEQLELVIAGDFIDFLALSPYQSWTADPTAACTKLTTVTQGACAPVFTALAGHVAAGHWLTILIGNHDIELTLPSAQAALLRIIEAHPHQVTFIDDGSAYRIGGALIEHGNRYDGANANDWEGLRYTRSALSRGEPPPRLLQVSAGSVMVEKIVNIFKPRYPFIDLLQPQDKLLAYLLFAFEPSLLRRNIGKLGHLLKGAIRQSDNPYGMQPGRTREVAAQREEMPDPRLEAELQAVFGPVYQQLEQPPDAVGASDWLPIVNQIIGTFQIPIDSSRKPLVVVGC